MPSIAHPKTNNERRETSPPHPRFHISVRPHGHSYESSRCQLNLHAETKNQAVWERLDQQRLSNNHLLCTDPDLKKRIKAIKCGDVVSIKGQLVSYSGRGSSVIRTDSGDGACETIFISQFEILDSMDNGWRTAYSVSLFAVIGTALAWLVAVGRGNW